MLRRWFFTILPPMKIAMLTGGGDVPGLNPAIKGLVVGACERGWDVVGIRCGWKGLLDFNRDDPESQKNLTLPLDELVVRRIDREGGTFLHSSRSNPSNTAEADLPEFLRGSADVVKKEDGRYDCTPHILKNLEYLGVDALIPIGGDDTLSYGERLFNEGFKVIGIPKTMDNDVHGTDYCLGYASCVTRSVEYLNNLRTSTGSHERFAVVEVMGRNAGFTSLIPAYLASCDHALIAEVPFEMQRLAALMSESRSKNPGNYAIMTVSEGATIAGGEIMQSGDKDPYGHQKLGGIGKVIGDELKKRTGVGIIFQSLGYLVRCGAPVPFDVMLTYNFANAALELASRQEYGRLVRVKDGVYGHAPMSILSEGLKRVDVDGQYDSDRYRPKINSVLGHPVFL